MKTVLLKNLLSLTVSLVIALSAVSQATAADSQYRRDEAANPLLVRPDSGGRLVIWRIANLGKVVGVNMWLDGMPIGVIGYGQIYAFTATGDHSGHLILKPPADSFIPNGNGYAGRAVSY